MPRPALAARALEGTRASGAQAVPSRPAGRWASPKRAPPSTIDPNTSKPCSNDSRFPIPDSRIPNPESRIPNPESPPLRVSSPAPAR
ncbi:hypothetical protein EX530_17725 [Xanthomonas phaseoli]